MSQLLSFGAVEILLAERRLRVRGQVIPLGSRAFDLLALLAAHRDRVVTKDELLDRVWPGLVVEENNVQVQISALRKVLGPQAITTLPGRGYRFTLAAPAAASMPVPEPVAAPSTASLRPSPGDGHRARLLVADDNKVNRLLLCRSLALLGHEVESTDNGRMALQRLRSERFDLLLLDLEMPELDGFGLLAERAADPALRELPVIVTSSLEGVAPVARCLEWGADDYLHKPVNPVLLKARVDSSLERKRLRDRQQALLARVVGPAGPHAGGWRGLATVMVLRLPGVHALAIDEPVDSMLEGLSDWHTLMAEAIEGRGGRIATMAGDGLMAVFAGPPAGPASATAAAQDLLAMAVELNRERVAAARVPITPVVGIASGELTTGSVGTAQRMVPACLGPAVARALALAADDAADGPIRVDTASLNVRAC